MLSSAIVMTDRNMRLLPLALWSVNPRFELPTVFIFKYLINPSMEYLIPIWWPSVSKIVQKHRGTRVSHCSCHCKTVSNSVCLSEGATVTKGGGAFSSEGFHELSQGLSVGHCTLLAHVFEWGGGCFHFWKARLTMSDFWNGLFQSVPVKLLAKGATCRILTQQLQHAQKTKKKFDPQVMAESRACRTSLPDRPCEI